MAQKADRSKDGVRVFPPPPQGFDALTATTRDLTRHGLPKRPDARKQPELAAFWEQRARRYQDFEHLTPELTPPDEKPEFVAAGLGLPALVSCGFELFDSSSPITMLSGTWTVPNLINSQSGGLSNKLHTFFGLGFLDVHVELTVDAANDVTTRMTIHTGAQVNFPVRPGDVISAVLCLQTNSAGTAFYGLANETTNRTMNFSIDTGFPPAVAINGGVTRDSVFNGPPDPLARFGVVYFDEVVAYAVNGTRLLTNGVPTTMVERDGRTLAFPQRLNSYAFKVVYRAS